MEPPVTTYIPQVQIVVFGIRANLGSDSRYIASRESSWKKFRGKAVRKYGAEGTQNWLTQFETKMTARKE